MISPNDSFINLATNDMVHSSDNLYSFCPNLYPISEEAKKAFSYITFFKKYSITDLNYYEFENLNDYCFLYTNQGEGIIKYNGQDYSLPSGSLLFINGTLLKHIHGKEMKEWNFYFILFNGSSISTYYELCTSEDLPLLHNSKSSYIPVILNKLESIIKPKSLENEAIQSKLITDLLTEIFVKKNSTQHITEIIPGYVLKIKELFDNKYSEPHTLDTIAKQFHRSKYKLSRDFSKYINISPIEYLICRRIEVAKDLLLETDEMIHDIGISIGMENTNHFISTFKKKTGVTPLTYRNLHQRNG